LAWFDRTGRETGRVGSPDRASLLNPALSPDGKRIAFERVGGALADVWTIDVGGAAPSRLTFGGARFPIWSPDGSRLVFTSIRRGSWEMYQKLASGAGEEELVRQGLERSTSNIIGVPTHWSRDGRFLLFTSPDAKSIQDVWAVPPNAADKAFPVIKGSGDERDGQFSPDGHWIAYQSNESGGRFEIFVQAFPGPGGKRQISTTGGTHARWRGDGRELFYIALDGTLMATPITFANTATVTAGVPMALFQTHLVGARVVTRPQVNRHQYDVAPDGQRFLLNMPVEEAATAALTVIFNVKLKS
jgi:Tol biopolymer transport system component